MPAATPEVLTEDTLAWAILSYGRVTARGRLTLVIAPDLEFAADRILSSLQAPAEGFTAENVDEVVAGGVMRLPALAGVCDIRVDERRAAGTWELEA